MCLPFIVDMYSRGPKYRPSSETLQERRITSKNKQQYRLQVLTQIYQVNLWKILQSRNHTRHSCKLHWMAQFSVPDWAGMDRVNQRLRNCMVFRMAHVRNTCLVFHIYKENDMTILSLRSLSFHPSSTHRLMMITTNAMA